MNKILLLKKIAYYGVGRAVKKVRNCNAFHDMPAPASIDMIYKKKCCLYVDYGCLLAQ